MRMRTLFLVFFLIELISLAAYFFPVFNTVGFLIIILAALVFSFKRLEYGLCFVLADLILGGKSGALFSFEYDGFFLSLRMALFIVVMGVWVASILLAKFKIQNSKFKILEYRDLKWWGILGVAVAWGLIVGLARGNNFGDLFLDANGYFYAALVLPFWWVFNKAKGQSFFCKDCPLAIIFFAATILLALKTLFAVYILTHAGNNFIAANLIPFYRWVRDTGVGEITWLKGNFARVFFQSHLYNIAALFALLVIYVGRSNLRGIGDWISRYCFYILILNTAVIIVSFSRSFWIGTLAGLLVFVVLMRQIRQLRQIGRMGLIITGAAVLGLGLILAVARFPFPRPSPMDLSAAAQSRLTPEAAAASRWNLLPPLWSAIKQHPIIGSGFGSTVTYISNDPRVREVSATGEYTTYALEWGWIDAWLKMGLMGLVGLTGLIGHIGLMLYRRAKIEPLYLAGLAGLAALTTIHVFTPYLNHPLGLGILILASMYVMMDS